MPSKQVAGGTGESRHLGMVIALREPPMTEVYQSRGADRSALNVAAARGPSSKRPELGSRELLVIVQSRRRPLRGFDWSACRRLDNQLPNTRFSVVNSPVAGMPGLYVNFVQGMDVCHSRWFLVLIGA
jgi:hypothetical protein